MYLCSRQHGVESFDLLHKIVELWALVDVIGGWVGVAGEDLVEAVPC